MKKEEIKTLDQAKAKVKKLIIGVAIVFAVISAVFMLINMFLGIIVAVFCVCLLPYIYFTETKKVKRNFCPDCGARYDYERCVSWNVSDVVRKTMNPNSNSQGKQVIQKDVATVCFTCICEECGGKREFSQKHDITRWYDDGTREDVNLQNIAENYFKI